MSIKTWKSRSVPQTALHFDYNKVLCVDVDDTLVLFKWAEAQLKDTIMVEFNGVKERLLPHWKHVEEIKKFKLRGIGVIVWSHGGHAWARSVVEMLGLDGHVDLIMGKPDWIIDDSPIKHLANARFYKDSVTGENLKLEEE